MESKVLDLLIVGAGIYGICAANTYLTLFPSHNIKVLDSDTDAGGTWSTSRLYPKFWSQTGARVSGFPDVPFRLPDDAETYHDLFEATHLAKYLEDYLDVNVYDGRKLRERFVFQCVVTNVKKVGSVWTVEALWEERRVDYRAKKVIIATGMTSVPNMPNLPGKDSYQENHTYITIMGGSKSAADIAYAAATDTHAERKVAWILRRGGSGPLSMIKAQGFGKYRNIGELGCTRVIASLSSANPWAAESWWSWFLHKTPVGEWLLRTLLRRPDGDSIAAGKFDDREGALEGFELLRPEGQARWRTGPVGMIQQEDFWDVIARRVKVYRQDVLNLKENAVVLDDKTEVRSHVLVCATGWTQTHPYFDPKEGARLGLPINFNHKDLVAEEREHWSKLEEEADRKVLTRWPYLAFAPQDSPKPVRETPYKLYNMTIPITDNSIAFLGQIYVSNNYHLAFVQTLYAIAVMDGVIELPSRDEMEQRVAFLNRWCARRYPAHGRLGNVVEFEMVSYTDHLLDQLGLSSHRNRESWWRDLTEPAVASDYAGLVDEYRRKYLWEEL